MASPSINQKCDTCGSCMHTIKSCWVKLCDDEGNQDVNISVPFSYASIVSRSIDNDAEKKECVDNFDDFVVVVSKKKIMTKKCEDAVLEWVKNKGFDVEPKVCDDDEFICNRCALPFVVNQTMKIKYEQRGWKIPKICKVCSQNRFEERRI
jgi:hypothetical protein